MHLYLFVLLAIVFINALFTLLSVDRFAHDEVNGHFDVYLLLFIALFVAVLAYVFMYMFMNAEKSLLS